MTVPAATDWWWLWSLGPLSQAWPQIEPNLVASLICFAVSGAVALAAWLWKVRPHLVAQREHREHVHRELAALHQKHDALHEKVRDIATASRRNST